MGGCLAGEGGALGDDGDAPPGKWLFCWGCGRDSVFRGDLGVWCGHYWLRLALVDCGSISDPPP